KATPHAGEVRRVDAEPTWTHAGDELLKVRDRRVGLIRDVVRAADVDLHAEAAVVGRAVGERIGFPELAHSVQRLLVRERDLAKGVMARGLEDAALARVANVVVVLRQDRARPVGPASPRVVRGNGEVRALIEAHRFERGLREGGVEHPYAILV